MSSADQSPAPTRTPEEVARAFHEAYERLAPAYGYRTRRESAVRWEDVPWANQALMIAVASEVLALVRPIDGIMLTLAEVDLVCGWADTERQPFGLNEAETLLVERLEAAL